MYFLPLVTSSLTRPSVIDIAVDGWALTLLSQENLSFASTCQTIGLNTGFFASFTVFLALNSEAFSYVKFPLVWCPLTFLPVKNGEYHV